MSRLPIRLKLTGVFAIAMAIVLILAGAFVYLRVRSNLDSALNDTLRTRVDDLAGQLQRTRPRRIELGRPRAEGSEDTLSAVLLTGGTVIASSEAPREPLALPGPDLTRAESGYVYFNARHVLGINGDARLLARPVSRRGHDYVVVVGASTGDRSETLSGLVKTFAIGAPLALLLASGLGYLMARLAMRPVEAMRVRAEEINLRSSGERLPPPVAPDEIGKLGETLNEMLGRIEKSVERERAFVADASHELRTPLSIMRTELELGMRPDRSEAAAKAAMRSATEEVERLQTLTDDLLALSRSDSDRLPIEREEVVLRDLLEGIRGRFIARAESEGRTISVEPGAPVVAELDRRKIEGALSNLVDNALRHGHGEVKLRAMESDAGFVELEATDEGPGFSAEFSAVAFDRFARSETGRTTPGSGLGLAIVRAIAEAHGGTVSITGGDGGATVAMRLPRGA